MPKIFKIACLQTRPLPTFSEALQEALELSKVAVNEGATFLALPEYCGGMKTKGTSLIPPTESEENHPVLNGIINFALNNNVFILLGSIAVSGPKNKIFNRSFIIDNNGAVLSRYDKIHMFDIELSKNEIYRESDSVIYGKKITVTETDFGKLGQTVCYDLRFPCLYRELSQAGAEILFVPAVFTKKTGEAHWHVLNRARAIENGAFVVSPCAYGDVDGGGSGYGHSMIVNPWGEVISDAGEGKGIIYASINLDEVKLARDKIPSLQHDRKFDLIIDKKKIVA